MAFWPQNASVFGNSVFIDPSGDTGVIRTYYCKASAMHTGLNSGKLAKMLVHQLSSSARIIFCQGMDFFIYGRNCCQFFLAHMRFGTKITPHGPQGWIFWTMTINNLKKFTSQDLSNEGSNFTLSPLEVGH